MRRRLLAVATLMALAVACAPPPAIVTAPVAPQHPDFVYPAPAEGTPAATVDRLARGWRLLQASDFAAADREFAALLTASRDFAPARAAAGYTALAQKRASDALSQFEAASPPGRPYPPALVGRGLALLDLTREEEALASFEAALAGDAGIPQLAERVATLRVRVVQDRIGRAERAAADARWDEARAAYRGAIEASPDAAFLYRDLAVVERRAGRPDTALELARAALIHDADDVRAHVLIGDVLAERGEFALALAAYGTAATLESTPALDATIARVRDRAREAALPDEYRAIPDRAEASRGDLAALMGVRVTALARAPQRQVVVTDVRGHWAEAWIQTVARSGAMEVYPNYTFQPDAPLRRLGLADAVSRALAVLRPAATVAGWDGTPVAVSDVPADHLAYPAVRRAVASGVLRLEGGAFDLLRPVSGADVVEAVSQLAAMSGARQ